MAKMDKDRFASKLFIIYESIRFMKSTNFHVLFFHISDMCLVQRSPDEGIIHFVCQYCESLHQHLSSCFIVLSYNLLDVRVPLYPNQHLGLQ